MINDEEYFNIKPIAVVLVLILAVAYAVAVSLTSIWETLK